VDGNAGPKSSRKKIVLWTAIAVAVLGATAAIGFFVPSLLRPSLDRTAIRTARVEVGDVAEGITATGKAVPENEQVLPSLLDARVVQVLKRVGDRVSQGDPIVQLDAGAVQADLGRARLDSASKQRELAKIKQDLEQTLAGLQSQQEIKKAEIEKLRATAEQRRNLFKDGVVSAADVRRAEDQEEKTQAELAQLDESKRNAESEAKAHVEQLSMEIGVLEGQRSTAERDLSFAVVKADNDGVLVWVADENSTVSRGDPIARIADTKSFRVEVDVSDSQAGRLRFGMPVNVTVGSAALQGSVTGMTPSAESGVVTIKVVLQDNSNPVLRPDLTVGVLIPTERKSGVLVIQKGPALTGENTREVFVVRGSTAVKTPVTLGVTSSDRCEVVQGLKEGDEVIVSDMSGFMHLNQVAIK
jgi:HlyD family secretion protein